MIKDFFMGFKSGLLAFGHSFSTVVNTLVLLIVYFLAIGPTSLIARLVGKHFLLLKSSRVKSYWQDLNLKRKSFEQYYRQF